jgi:hypothetical protein
MQTYKKQYDPNLVKFVEHIASRPSGPERWGLAIKAWLLKNETVDTPTGPLTAREYNALQIEHNKRLRAVQNNKFATTAEGGLRFGLSIPEGAWQMVKLVDPLAFRQMTGNEETVRRNLRLFMRAFPEYAIPEKI